MRNVNIYNSEKYLADLRGKSRDKCLEYIARTLDIGTWPLSLPFVNAS